jgi:N-acetylmuramoyl-L-alanine amidase
MDTAIIIGHTSLKQGAYSSFLNSNEWDFNKRISESLKEVASIYTYDTYQFGYTSMVKRMANRINDKKHNLVLELHFNASESPNANGSEALYYFKNKSAQHLSECFTLLMNTEMGIKNRGAKALYSKNQRGYASVYYPKPTTLILEPFFGTNLNDCKLFNECAYVEVIKKLIRWNRL